jgi:hypothetical protein
LASTASTKDQGHLLQRYKSPPEPIPNVPSTFWAIGLGRDHRETMMGDILSAFYQRSAGWPPSECDKESAVGACISATT